MTMFALHLYHLSWGLGQLLGWLLLIKDGICGRSCSGSCGGGCLQQLVQPQALALLCEVRPYRRHAACTTHVPGYRLEVPAAQLHAVHHNVHACICQCATAQLLAAAQGVRQQVSEPEKSVLAARLSHTAVCMPAKQPPSHSAGHPPARQYLYHCNANKQQVMQAVSSSCCCCMHVCAAEADDVSLGATHLPKERTPSTKRSSSSWLHAPPSLSSPVLSALFSLFSFLQVSSGMLLKFATMHSLCRLLRCNSQVPHKPEFPSPHEVHHTPPCETCVMLQLQR